MNRTFYVDPTSSSVMLDIYKYAPILNKLPLDIECLHAYDDYLIVGTKQGHLLMYKLVAKPSPEPKFDVHILRSNKAFAKKAIVQIEALPEFHILISLSDNMISVHNLDPINSPLICCIDKSRGATLFATDVQRLPTVTGEQQSLLRLCVVVKRKLMVFFWKSTKQRFEELAPDLLVPDVPKVVAWCAESLCVCLKTEYLLIKYNSGEQKELFPLGKNEPLISSLDKGRLIALGVDDKTYVLDNEAAPVLRIPISWGDIPIALVDDMPYLMALLPNSVVEIQTMEPRLSIQRIADFSSLAGSKMKQLVKCTNKKGRLFVASNNDVYCLFAVPVAQQIPQLLREKQFELALELAASDADLEPDKREETAKKIKNLHAFDLFCRKDFKGSMNLFTTLETDPALVIGLFPDLLPEVYRSKIEYPSQPPRFEGSDLRNGLLALIDYLLQVRRKLSNPSSSDAFAAALSETSGTAPSSAQAKKLQLRQIVDTTLLKCYLQTSDALVASLLRLPDNHCHLEETEQALKRFHKYNELIILYQSKGLHKRALDLLKKQSKKSDSHLFGHERTVHYLQHLGADNLSLIFEYASWVVEEHPEDGLRIFTDDIGLETENLPREQILEYLEKTNQDLVIPYLEHIISNWHDTSPAFHNKLVHRYREKVRVLLPEYTNSLPEGHQVAAAGEEPGELGIYRSKLLAFLATSDHYSTEMLRSYLLNDGLFDERAVVMGKIGNHEEALAIYVHILQDGAKAEAYCNEAYDKSRPGNKDVFFMLLKLYLSVAVSTVDSSASAEPQPPTPQSQKDVAPSNSRLGKDAVCDKNIAAAVELLSKHATKIDPLQALLLLPAWMPLTSVKRFLETVTKHFLTDRRGGQIFRNLLLSQHLQVQGQRIRLQQALKIVIDDHDLCGVCQKKIGKSAFLRFPNSDLVHYSCQALAKEKYYTSDNGPGADHY